LKSADLAGVAPLQACADGARGPANPGGAWQPHVVQDWTNNGGYWFYFGCEVSLRREDLAEAGMNRACM
jgi:hypothetical protein